MPRSAYSSMRCATVSASPTRAVPAPLRTRPMPAQRLGLTSRSSELPLTYGCHSPLSLRIETGKPLLGFCNYIFINISDQIIGSPPRFFGCLAHNHMEAECQSAEFDLVWRLLHERGRSFRRLVVRLSPC